jgi:hypothetical protein
MLIPPLPYDEDLAKDKFWKPDPHDHVIPKQKGFITDYVYSQRGTEIPTLYGIWSALYLLSTALKREAWIEWYPKKMFANLYMIFLGPPGRGKKSSTLDSQVYTILHKFPQYIESRSKAQIKATIRTLTGKATPEALLEALKPEKSSMTLLNAMNEPMKKSNGELMRYKPGAQLAIILSEMSTTINKQQYAQTMIENLLTLFDCHDQWDWRTVKRNVIRLEKLYTTFVGATTWKGFRESLPGATLGDGFLSRTIIVPIKTNPREMFPPRSVPEGPDMEQIMKRLAFIAERTWGEYTIDSDAKAAYREWYHHHIERTNVDPEYQDLYSRIDNHILKLMLLMKAQAYHEQDNIIRVEHFEAARDLMLLTTRGVADTLGEIGGDDSMRRISSVATYIEDHKEVTRAKLMQNMKLSARDTNEIINTLKERGEIYIYRGDGKKGKSRSNGKGGEVYRWRTKKEEQVSADEDAQPSNQNKSHSSNGSSAHSKQPEPREVQPSSSA